MKRAKTPAPSPAYVLDEAARFRGYTQAAWEREDWRVRARVVAHYLEHSLREAYGAEAQMKRSRRRQTGNGPTVEKPGFTMQFGGGSDPAQAPDKFWKHR